MPALKTAITFDIISPQETNLTQWSTCSNTQGGSRPTVKRSHQGNSGVPVISISQFLPYTHRVNSCLDSEGSKSPAEDTTSDPSCRDPGAVSSKPDISGTAGESWFRKIMFHRSIRVVVGLVGILALFITIVVPNALKWRSGQKWEDFLQQFATSPAAAGCAAVVAAAIAAITFNNGLKHTKDESRANRKKEAAEAWWSKFEWVTDRLIPKDAGQERIAKPLAANLLVSLSKMATEDFQREAVIGITSHYLPEMEDDSLHGVQPRNIDAEARSLRNLADSVASPAASSAALAAEYEQAGIRALHRKWDRPNELEVLPRIRLHTSRYLIPDAVLHIKGRQIALDFKAWSRFNPAALERTVDRYETAIANKHLTDLVVVSMAEAPKGYVYRGENVHVVDWANRDSPETLIRRISAIIDALPDL